MQHTCTTNNAHTLTPLPHSCAMAYGQERTDVHAVLSAWSNERAAWKRRVPVTGRMYSPLPRSGSWSFRWAGRRCCGKERWAWRRCYCYVAQHRSHSSGLGWNRQSTYCDSRHDCLSLRKKHLLCNPAPQKVPPVFISGLACKYFLVYYSSFWPTFHLQPVRTYYTCLA